jgi:SAM-dependent methyltransferase
MLVEGDGLKLPFLDGSFDVVITRLAEYSPQEAYRVLKKGGFFFEYNLGPEANKEIMEFFPERIERENFFFPHNAKGWKREVSEKLVDAGFSVESIEDYKEKERYKMWRS